VYHSYQAAWRGKNGEQRLRSFSYASLNKRTGKWQYDADLELLAFRCALHFRHIYLWYREQGLLLEFEDQVKRYKNLKVWYAYKPECIFLEF